LITYKALDRAAMTQFLWKSLTTPFPKGVGKKGKSVLLINSVISYEALQ
jgi:hypothetical protein